MCDKQLKDNVSVLCREMEAIRSRAPHLREEYLTKSHRIALSKKKVSKARSIERVIAKERDRSQKTEVWRWKTQSKSGHAGHNDD